MESVQKNADTRPAPSVAPTADAVNSTDTNVPKDSIVKKSAGVAHYVRSKHSADKKSADVPVKKTSADVSRMEYFPNPLPEVGTPGPSVETPVDLPHDSPDKTFVHP